MIRFWIGEGVNLFIFGTIGRDAVIPANTAGTDLSSCFSASWLDSPFPRFSFL